MPSSRSCARRSRTPGQSYPSPHVTAVLAMNRDCLASSSPLALPNSLYACVPYTLSLTPSLKFRTDSSTTGPWGTGRNRSDLLSWYRGEGPQRQRRSPAPHAEWLDLGGVLRGSLALCTL